MPTVIINGRRVTIPGPQAQGRDIISQVNPRDGRRTVIYSGIEAQTIEPYKTYRDSDLIDKRGNPVKVTTIPDRTKGSFWGIRSQYSKSIITEQVYDIAAHYFKSGVEFDEENADWLKIPKYVLPKIWHHIAQSSPLLIVFPTEYPEQPPIGFYLQANLAGAPDGHMYSNVYHQAAREPLAEGWKWYCVYINPGSWQPARVRKPGDWKYGDNLWTYFTLIKEALSTT
jgi:hypothetical protein